MRQTTLEFPGEAMLFHADNGAVTVSIPIRIKRYSCRRQVVVPQGISAHLVGEHEPTALQIALTRGHRWMRQVESGKVTNLTEIDKQEKLGRSYISRMVNLTTLAPGIVSAILDETLPENVSLFDLAVDTPLSSAACSKDSGEITACEQIATGCADLSGFSFSQLY